MNKFLIILLFSLSACKAELDTIIFKKFQKFITKFNKKYSSINEYLARYEVFKQNIMETFSNEKATYITGITKFSDLTKQEFKRIYLNLKYDAMAMSNFNPIYVKKTKNQYTDRPFFNAMKQGAQWMTTTLPST